VVSFEDPEGAAVGHYIAGKELQYDQSTADLLAAIQIDRATGELYFDSTATYTLGGPYTVTIIGSDTGPATAAAGGGLELPDGALSTSTPASRMQSFQFVCADGY